MAMFLSGQRVRAFIEEDRDNYLHSLSKADLCARKVQSRKEYRQLAISAVREFSEDEKVVLKRAVQVIGEMLTKAKIHNEAAGLGVLTLVFRRLQVWKFALMTERYENGFPHTREDIIFLTPSVFEQSALELVFTLVHEQIHIIQRFLATANKSVLEFVLREFGFVSLGTTLERLVVQQSNPDADGQVYVDVGTGQLCISLYASECPQSIEDLADFANKEQVRLLVRNKDLYRKLSTVDLWFARIPRPFVLQLQRHPFEQIADFYAGWFCA